MHTAKFDGLAQIYDKYRPRYPQILLETIKYHLQTANKKLNIVDIGAGIGIVLESLMEVFGTQHNYIAIDISQDMISLGKQKFPLVDWQLGKIEDIMPNLKNIDLFIAGQSYQWLDRLFVCKLAKELLNNGGIFAILQNNRDFNNSKFFSEYESLLEETSDGYSRNYRSFDIFAELKDYFNNSGQTIVNVNHFFSKEVSNEFFIKMSESSTQVQRAIKKDKFLFETKLTQLLNKHSVKNKLTLSYESQLYLAVK